MAPFERYKMWLEGGFLSPEDREELEKIKDNKKEIEDRFFGELEFGTGGIRGIMGIGSMRMNVYNIGRVSQAIAQYIKEKNLPRKVVISFDTRNNSSKFSRYAAEVFSANGIETYLFRYPRPTPELSFAVSHLGCGMGVMVTASHNPPEYNGYKAYGPNGAQIISPTDKEITEYMTKIDFKDIRRSDENIILIDKEVDEAYLQTVTGMWYIQDLERDIKIIYTPLHGVGAYMMEPAFQRVNYYNIYTEPHQRAADPYFSTVKSPNPEDPEGGAFDMSVKLADELGADYVFASDPDADRMGVMVRDGKEFRRLTGNQVGLLLADYLIRRGKELGTLPDNPYIVKTIVSTYLIDKMGEAEGFRVINTYTGFKNICNVVAAQEEKGDYGFILGFEESIGYTLSSKVKDKDSIGTSLALASMVGYYKKIGVSLFERLEGIYKKYGYYLEDQLSLVYKGVEGKKKIEAIMEGLRKSPPPKLLGMELTERYDYMDGIKGLPPGNVLEFHYGEKFRFFGRPSGTEPKIKFYLMVTGADSEDKALSLLAEAKKELKEYVEGFVR